MLGDLSLVCCVHFTSYCDVLRGGHPNISAQKLALKFVDHRPRSLKYSVGFCLDFKLPRRLADLQTKGRLANPHAKLKFTGLE